MSDTRPYKGLLDLRGKTVVVTGGCGLLGAEFVKCFASCGANVVVADVLEEPGVALSKEVVSWGGLASFFHFDQSKLAVLSEQIGALEDTHGAVDAWINNAYPRTQDWAARLEDISLESWRLNVDMQLSAYCLISNEVARRMALRGRGSIVNMGSIQSVVAPEFSVYDGSTMTSPPAYTAIKGGVLMYSKYLASYYGSAGVRVNVLCPGGIENNQPSSFVEKYAARTPMRRLARPDEIAPSAVFLASDAASYITGTCLLVDGGLTAV